MRRSYFFPFTFKVTGIVSFGMEEPAGFESVCGCCANTGPAEANKPAIPNRDKKERRVDVPNPLNDSDVSSSRFSSDIQTSPV